LQQRTARTNPKRNRNPGHNIGLPTIVFAAILGILLNIVFVVFKTPEVRGG
jgi:hypothetical protein